MVTRALDLAAVKAEVELQWGWSVAKPFFTAYQPTFKVIPLTTLLGALAYPYAVIENRPEVVNGKSSVVEVMKYVIWVTESVSIDPRLLIETAELTKVMTVLGVRAPHIYIGSPYLWAAQQRGRVYAPSYRFKVAYISSKPEDVERYAWGVWRVGSRESPAAALHVSVRRLSVGRSQRILTKYVFPERLSRNVRGDYIKVELPTINALDSWFDLGLKGPGRLLEPHIIPVHDVEVEVSDIGLGLIDEDDEGYVVPKDAVA